MSNVIVDDLTSICRELDDALRPLAGKAILIAGAGGFLPSYLVDVLAYANEHTLPQPCRIICVDNFKTGVPARLAHLAQREDVVLRTADITLSLELDEPVDYIVHAASIASPVWYRQFPLETIDVNVLGTRQLLEMARRKNARAFLYLSSSEIYGDPPPELVPTPEEFWGHVSCTGPRACYDESKRLAETLCMTYYRTFGTPVKIVRPFNVYGPRMRLDDGRVMPDFIRNALAGHDITLYSSGQATRSFCYIADAVTAMLLVLTSEAVGEAFNVGNAEEVTIGDLARLVAETWIGDGERVRFESNSDPNYLVDNPNRRCPDLAKLRRTFAWDARVSLRDGVRRTFRHYTEEQA